MNSWGRRDFIKTMSLFAVVPALKTTARYDSAAKFDLKISEVEYRRARSGRSLMARIYQPAGAGPFPAVLDLHGGAWNNKNRTAEEPMDKAIASSGSFSMPPACWIRARALAGCLSSSTKRT